MEEFIGCDAHKQFSVFVSINEKGKPGRPCEFRTSAARRAGTALNMSSIGIFASVAYSAFPSGVWEFSLMLSM